MSKIVVKKQEYANNGTHANEIEAVVKENILTNTLSTSTDNAPTVGLLKTNIDLIGSLLYQHGTFTPVIDSGGSAITWTSGNFDYYLVGNLCTVNYLFWGMKVTNPTTADFKLKLPFICDQQRAYGIIGYQSFGTTYANMKVGAIIGNAGMFFSIPTGTGEQVLKGDNVNTSGVTWQCSMTYITNKVPVSDTNPTPV